MAWLSPSSEEPHANTLPWITEPFTEQPRELSELLQSIVTNHSDYGSAVVSEDCSDSVASMRWSGGMIISSLGSDEHFHDFLD